MPLSNKEWIKPNIYQVVNYQALHNPISCIVHMFHVSILEKNVHIFIFYLYPYFLIRNSKQPAREIINAAIRIFKNKTH